jgi:hypothetical protein
MTISRSLLLLSIPLALGATAEAQSFTDDFEGYANGSLLEGQGGWRGWDGVPDTVATVTNANAFDGAQSVGYGAGTDIIQETAIYSGRWVVSAQVYVPSGSTGGHWLVFLNDYNDLGPYEWGGQIELDSDLGEARADCGGTGSGTAPLVTDAWTEVRLVLDIDADMAELYYDGTLLVTWQWTTGWNGTGNFAVAGFEALDVWSPDGSATAFLDAVDIRPESGAPGTTFCDGDGSGTACPCGNSNDGSLGVAGCANGSSAGGATLRGSGSNSVGAGDLVLEAAGLVPGQPGLFFQGDNAINGGAGAPFGDGLRCAGMNVARLEVRNASASGEASTTVNVGASGGVSSGDQKQYQYWYRDPAGSPCGSSFNLTNGYEIDWMP